MNDQTTAHVEMRDLELSYGSFVVLRNVNASIQRGEVFVIMGGSGCGKSTLLWSLIGLRAPAKGDVLFHGRNFLRASDAERDAITRKFGVLFQGGGLWSSMTLAENIALPLSEFTELSKHEITSLVRLKLALVGLAGFEDYYPGEISGGMMKRAGLARALALDPEILFFDEPSAGLDPVTSHRLDRLMLQLRDSFGTTLVVVTHELDSIFAIADKAMFLDNETRTVGAIGSPKELLQRSEPPGLRAFLRRGKDNDPERDQRA